LQLAEKRSYLPAAAATFFKGPQRYRDRGNVDRPSRSAKGQVPPVGIGVDIDSFVQRKTS